MLHGCRTPPGTGIAATRGADVADDKRGPDEGTEDTGTENPAPEEAVVEDLEADDDESVSGGGVGYRTATYFG